MRLDVDPARLPQWSLGLGFDGLLQKACPGLGLSMGLDKPITECGYYEREPGESNITRLHVEMGA
jgi:hypothetical protein